MIDLLQAENSWEGIPDLETVTLCSRTSATSPSGSDSFSAFTLFHAKRKPATRELMPLSDMDVPSETVTFDLYQDDLNNCGLPNPQQPFVTYLILDQTFGTFNGTVAVNSQTVTGIGSTVGLIAGMGIVGPYIPAGALIQVVGANQITLSQPATNSGVVQLTAGDTWTVEKLDRVITKAKWVANCRKAY